MLKIMVKEYCETHTNEDDKAKHLGGFNGLASSMWLGQWLIMQVQSSKWDSSKRIFWSLHFDEVCF